MINPLLVTAAFISFVTIYAKAPVRVSRTGIHLCYSSEKKHTVFSSGNGVRGGFRCACDPSPDGSCNSSIIKNKIVCGGDACCKIIVTIYGSDDLTMQKAEEKPEKLKWERMVLPTKSN